MRLRLSQKDRLWQCIGVLHLLSLLSSAWVAVWPDILQWEDWYLGSRLRNCRTLQNETTFPRHWFQELDLRNFQSDGYSAPWGSRSHEFQIQTQRLPWAPPATICISFPTRHTLISPWLYLAAIAVRSPEQTKCYWSPSTWFFLRFAASENGSARALLDFDAFRNVHLDWAWVQFLCQSDRKDATDSRMGTQSMQ